ncbi:DUF4190 domain-containing protein [Micromonospora inyonensis]|uniref:DUF4190 domain-containing protein n=1 Tax=Micromonospora inyonensis TaxID=47866 RepID=A0A1C6RMH0_9ACTN|nr:DUF4190 domain-containing protein [Micromonospora inyonensis]SCL18309.1 protein of unknown function [Micromonospora inyonensis]
MSYPPPSDPGWGEQPHKGDQPHWGEQPQPYWGGQPPYPPPPAYGPYGPAPASGTMNVMAILSLVFAFVFAPVGILLGHMARRQIRQTHEQGEQLAFWGLIASYVITGLYLLFCCGWLSLVVWAGANSGTTT